LHFRAAEMRLRREHNSRAWLAWHVAALQRQNKLPAMRNLLVAEPDRKMKQQLAGLRSWVASRGGKINHVKKG
jgi:hypothetical protein